MGFWAAGPCPFVCREPPQSRKTRNPAHQLSQMTGRIVCTVGRAAPTGCLRCLSVLRVVFLPARLKRHGIPWMMKPKLSSLPSWLNFAAASLVLLSALPVRAQNAPDVFPPDTAAPASKSSKGAPAKATPAESVAPAALTPDRAQAYYHLALANSYEEDAAALGRPELVTQAIEEYKLALNADPGSPQLNDGLADLYLRTGHIHESEATARELLKSSPDDVAAHRLLGKIYLRQLSDASNAVSSSSPAGNALDLALAEFEKIVALQPNSVEDRMVLGQLYTVKHDGKKAEEEFKTAQAIEPDSEEVVLNLACLYGESGDLVRVTKLIEAVPVADRSPKMEFALGTAYDQLKQPKDAIAAFQRAADMEPGDERTLDALGQALLNDDQLDEALKQFKLLADADPENAEALIHIAEIERRQGKYEDALATVRNARKKDPSSLEAGFNEGLLLDVLARYDEAAQVYDKMVDLTSHANGAYTGEEKNRRSVFLERLGAVYHEENKIDQAIAAYQKMIDMGGDAALRGYQEQVDAYRDAKQFDKSMEIARKAVDANPKNRELKLTLAGEMADQGNADEGLALAKGLLDTTENDRPVWLWLAQMDIRLRRWKDADEALAKAGALTKKKDDQISLLFLKGEWAERQKDYKQAEQFFREALDKDPSNAMTLNYLGYMLADKGTDRKSTRL